LRDSGDVHIFLGNLFRLQYAENTGAFLSLGAGLPDGIRTLIMTGLNTIILGGLICYLFAVKQIALFPALALTLIAGGGIGNLIDRIFRDGRVVDFMNMGITTSGFSLRTGVFNIADIAIMAGLFLIIAHEIFFARKNDDTPPSGK
jgi:signal peptidase II